MLLLVNCGTLICNHQAAVQATKDTSKVSECIEQVYPGGFKVFEEAFTNFCK